MSVVQKITDKNNFYFAHKKCGKRSSKKKVKNQNKAK
jgi:hypothetical protein